MKKILSVFLACVLLVGCICTLASCGKSLSGAYEAEVELFGQSASTTYDFSGKKVEIITKTKLLGSINTETVKGTYEIAEADGELEITITTEKDGEEVSNTYTLEEGDGYIKIAGIQYNKVD